MTETAPTTLKGLLHADDDVDISADIVVHERPVAVPTEAEAADAYDPEYLEAEHNAITPGLRSGTALLCVQSNKKEGRLHLTMTWHHDGPPREARDLPVPEDIEPAAAIVHRARDQETNAADEDCGDTPWRDAFEDVRGSWKGIDALAEWVKGLRQSEHAAPELVIWDSTSQDLPWELYYGRLGDVEDGVPQRGWLGAALPVSRWVDDGQPSLDAYRGVPRDVYGGVLLFDDGETHKEKDATKWRRIYSAVENDLVGELEHSIDKLLGRLEGSERFGLLVIRGHGYHDATDPRKFILAGLTLRKLEGCNLNAIYHNQPTVLLNLCSSGRTLLERNRIGEPVRGFAAEFLERGASTVIAVLADVDVTHLHSLTVELVTSAAAQQIVVPEWLRKQRAYYRDALKRESENIDTEDLYRMFLTSSLYVCFCHPQTTLRITGSAERSETGVEGTP